MYSDNSNDSYDDNNLVMREICYFLSRRNNMGQISGWSKCDNLFRKELRENDELITKLNVVKCNKKKCINRICSRKVSNKYGICKKCYDKFSSVVKADAVCNDELRTIKKLKNTNIISNVNKLLPKCDKCGYSMNMKETELIKPIENNKINFENHIIIGHVGRWKCPQQNGGCGCDNNSKFVSKNEMRKLQDILEHERNEKLNETLKKYNTLSYQLVEQHIISMN